MPEGLFYTNQPGAGLQMQPVAPTAASQNWLGPVSSGFGFASDILQAASLRSSSRNMRKVAKQLWEMAAQAMEQGIETGRDITHRGAETIGTMTATFGKSGSLLEGSPLLTLADETREIELNIARAIEQGRIRSEAYKFQARQAGKAAHSLKMASNAAAIMAPIKTIGSFGGL